MTTNEDTPWLLSVMTFYAEAAPPVPLPDGLPELNLPPAFGRYLLLADDGGSFLCVDTQSDAVVCVDPPQEGPGRSVNSGAAQFTACIQTYAAQPGPAQAREASKETLKGWTEQLRADIAAIDPAALVDPDNCWWSLVIEDQEVFTQ